MRLKSFKEIHKKKIKFQDQRVRGIYFLFDEDDLVYVGSSIDCIGRVLFHRKDKKFDSYSVVELTATKIEMLKLEDRYIQKHKPKLNKTIKRVNLSQIKTELTEYEEELSDNIGLLIKKQEFDLVDYEIDEVEYWTAEQLNDLKNPDGSRSDEYFYYKRIMKDRIGAGHFKGSHEVSDDGC